MAQFNFACSFLKVEDGTEIIKCRDLPELLSWPANGETMEDWARYAVEDCIAFRIKDGEKIPTASPAEKDEFVVRLSAVQEAKILLHNAMVDDGVSRSELARKAGIRLPDVTRLLNIKHQTKIDTIRDVMNLLGKDIEIRAVTI